MPFALRLSAVAAVAIALPAFAAPAVAACRAGPVTVALPAQRLDERLQALARLTGCTVDVDPALLAGRRAAALRGAMPTDQAFFRSVRGSGLEAGPVQGHWRVDRAQQVYFAARIADTEARLRGAERGRRIAPAQAADDRRTLARIGTGVTRYVRDQGFLSAAERSSYTALLDRLDQRLRRSSPPPRP